MIPRPSRRLPRALVPSSRGVITLVAGLCLTAGGLMTVGDARAQDPPPVETADPASAEEAASEEAKTTPKAPTPPTATDVTPLTLAEEGVTAHRAGDYPQAQTKLEEAYRELPLPTIGLWLARNLDASDRLLDAQERYRAIVEEKPAETEATLAAARARGLSPPDAKEQKEAKEDAELELERLVARIPTLLVRVEGAPEGEAAITLDGAEAPLAAPRQIDPGRYRISGSWQDQTIQRAIVLHERDRAVVGLPFRTEEVERVSGDGQRVVGWVLVGTGAVAAAVGGVVAGIAWGKLNELDCPENRCQPSQREEMDAYNGLRLPAGFLIVGGGLLAATGVGVILNAPSGEVAASVEARLGPGFVGVGGRF